MGNTKNNNGDPAVLFYTSDFLSGVMDLDMEERGQYITLLCAQHQKGHLSEKTIILLVGSCSESVLKKFKIDEDGLYFHPRMDIEIAKRLTYKGGRIKNLMGGKKDKSHMDSHVDTHMDAHMDSHMETPYVKMKMEMEIEDENSGKHQHKSAQTAYPTKSEVVAFFVENGYRGDVGAQAFGYYADADWVDSRGNKVRSWKQKMRSVWFKDEHKKPENEIDMVKAKKDADDFYNSRMGPADLHGFKIVPEVEEDYEVDRSDEQGDET